MADHALAPLDTSCVINWPREAVAESFAISTLTIAELAYGLHHDDPLVSAAREARYRMVLSIFEPIPYSARAARTSTARSRRPYESQVEIPDRAGST